MKCSTASVDDRSSAAMPRVISRADMSCSFAARDAGAAVEMPVSIMI
jgi:hypothetical protein